MDEGVVIYLSPLNYTIAVPNETEFRVAGNKTLDRPDLNMYLACTFLTTRCLRRRNYSKGKMKCGN